MSLADIQSMKALKTVNNLKNSLRTFGVNKYRPFAVPNMTTPPTVTLTQGGASNISGSVNLRSIPSGSTVPNDLFRYTGNVKRADWQNPTLGYSGTGTGVNAVKPTGISTSANDTGYLEVEFDFDGTDIEITVAGNGQGTSWNIQVDEGDGFKNVFAGLPPNIPLDGATYQIYLKFASRMLRRIRYQAYGNFFGINMGSNDTIFPSARPLGARAIFLGDSFTEGSGATGWHNGYAHLICNRFGWECWNSGSGGTGFVNPSSGLNRLKYYDRIQRDVIANNPDVVIVQGGQNDTTYPASDVLTQANAVFSTLKSSLPTVPIIAVSNVMIGGSSTAILQTRDSIKTASLQNGVALIDSIDGTTYDFKGNTITNALGNWYTGSGGNIANVQPAGNKSYYTHSDGGHPSVAGHQYIAERISREILKLIG
jgi:lysophospholipase L1-like esterase